MPIASQNVSCILDFRHSVRQLVWIHLYTAHLRFLQELFKVVIMVVQRLLCCVTICLDNYVVHNTRYAR